MTPFTFVRLVHKLEPLIDARCAAETRDAIAYLACDLERLDVRTRDAFMAICSELFLRIGAGRRR